MKKVLFVLMLWSGLVFSQTDCGVLLSEAANIPAVDASDIRCIARNTTKQKTMFYTFGIWCEPCVLHLPNAVRLAREYDLEFYILLVDAEADDYTLRAVQQIREQAPEIKLAVLKNSVYGEKRRKRNKKFVTEITPPAFENIDDYSKYILLDKTGEVIMVTTWKDNEKNDWRDDSKMTQERIVPLLTTH